MKSLCKDFSDLMKSEFEISMMGELKFFLGFKSRKIVNEYTYINKKYTKELLKKFKMKGVKPMEILMHASNPLSRDESSKLADQTIYRGIIGSLLYLTISKPDIMYSVYLCARFQSNPQESHHKVVKSILCYLVGTTNQSLFFKKNQDFMLVGYCDANYAANKVERKSTSGGCHYIGPYLISWTNKKQNFIVLSRTKLSKCLLQVVAHNYCG